MDRDARIDGIVRALRRVNFQGSLFGQTVAIRLGLSDSDVEALEMLLDSGAATAGRLADLMGLTTGAVTRVIDRLEQGGYVRRVPDMADRRRVIVEVVPEKLTGLQAMIGNVARAGSEEVARYSDAQLALIGEFLGRMADVTKAEAEKLREEPSAAAATTAENAAPVAGLTSARLVFRSGISSLTLRGDRAIADLYRARFEGAVPKVRTRDGTVSVQYRGFFDWHRRSADIGLNTGLPWSIEVSGGANKLTADLRLVDLRSFEISGGASKVDIALGRPHGEVPIKVLGGASGIRLDRPHGVALRLTVVGGVGKAELDGRPLGPQAGQAVVETPGAANATDRFAVEIVGGVNKATITERPGP